MRIDVVKHAYVWRRCACHYRDKLKLDNFDSDPESKTLILHLYINSYNFFEHLNIVATIIRDTYSILRTSHIFKDDYLIHDIMQNCLIQKSLNKVETLIIVLFEPPPAFY